MSALIRGETLTKSKKQNKALSGTTEEGAYMACDQSCRALKNLT